MHRNSPVGEVEEFWLLDANTAMTVTMEATIRTIKITRETIPNARSARPMVYALTCAKRGFF